MSNPVIDLKHLTIRQADRVILGGVNLRLAAGEFAYLVGRTGSGKSSLLKTIYGDLPPGGGSGTVLGFELDRLNRKSIPQLRRRLGVVFQDYNLLMDRSVAQNLDFVLRATDHRDKKARSQRINEVLAAVGLTEKLHVMPHALSGGERQRIAFARALLNHPDLLIADEATGNLDPETSDEILLLMRRLAEEEGCAVLFATHDYRILENFQARIIRCHNGRVFNQEEMIL